MIAHVYVYRQKQQEIVALPCTSYISFNYMYVLKQEHFIYMTVISIAPEANQVQSRENHSDRVHARLSDMQLRSKVQSQCDFQC